MQTQHGLLIGTPQFMSPEQARGTDVDHQTDIFSFGVVMYEMLSGVSPFAGDTVSDVIVAVLTRDPPPLADVPPRLAAIVSKAMQKDKQRRYQTATDLLRDLTEVKQELDADGLRGPAASRPDAEGAAQRRQAQPTASAGTRSDTHDVKSVAVLPFVNMSADGDDEHFCDGLAEELLNALSKIDALKVAARTSAFSFKGKSATVSTIATDAGRQQRRRGQHPAIGQSRAHFGSARSTPRTATNCGRNAMTAR